MFSSKLRQPNKTRNNLKRDPHLLSWMYSALPIKLDSVNPFQLPSGTGSPMYLSVYAESVEMTCLGNIESRKKLKKQILMGIINFTDITISKPKRNNT